eukprot:CAMPEP_0170545266 /NCGR_PEP_ID=MMETSP0211-20121228/3717_1 /TAXON_ID=311385 /ORGANISM="Pseudokeronopsis sp., Strain OXSARD2" /LENGTH=53 /DNA_ID=CAMNT_0010849121 /DNA_START=1256 /DNA_END=1417 /DNA_ORIENTATION=-
MGVVVNGEKLSYACFGAHNDSKVRNGVSQLYMVDENILCSLGFDGSIRNWALS